MRQTPYDLQEEDAKQIGERLRWVRELVDLSPTQLAANIGVDSSSVRHIEGGLRLPSLRMLMAICHVLRISPQYLLWGNLAEVEPELAQRLKAEHPQLSWPAASPAPDNSHSSTPSRGQRPRIRGRHTVSGSV